MNLEEFNYQFGVNGAENLIRKLNQIEAETEELDQAVSHLGNTFQQFFDVALRSSIPPAFIKMVMDQAMAFSKQAEYIDRLSQVSGMSARQIQQLGYALHRFGGDVATATSQLDHLQTKLENMKKPLSKGGGAVSELARIAKKHGVNLKGINSSFDLLKAISVRMEKLSERKKISLARAFGLDDSTFLLVKKGLKEVEDALYKAQKYILFDEKDIRQAKEFEGTLKDISADITLISKSFSFGAIPEMQKFANVMRTVTDYLSDHKEVVKGLGMTTFGAGAYGIFRLLNLLPTKFLKGAAGVLGTGLGIGLINEDIDKINRGYRNKTIIGRLEKQGHNKTASYVEAIWRAIYDLTNKKSLDGVKKLLEKIQGDLELNYKKQSENVKKGIDEGISKTKKRLSEYKSAFSHHGMAGVTALMFTNGENDAERKKSYYSNLEQIKAQGGVIPFLWGKLKETFEELKKAFTSADLWKPIFDNINKMVDTIKGAFLDLIIFLKRKTGGNLTIAEKAHLLRKQIQSQDREKANKAIKQYADAISNEPEPQGDVETERKNLLARTQEIAKEILENNPNSGYSEREVVARLLYNVAKTGTLAKGSNLLNDITGMLKPLGITREEITKIYSENAAKNEAAKEAAAKKASQLTIDLTPILDQKQFKKVNLKKVSFEDFVDKVMPQLTPEQIIAASNKFNSIMTAEEKENALKHMEGRKTSPFSPYLQDWNVLRNKYFGSDEENEKKLPKELQTGLGKGLDKIFGDIAKKLEPFTKFMKGFSEFLNTHLKPKMLERIKVTHPANEILKKDAKDLTFSEVFLEMLKSEIHDVYENFLNIDDAIRKIPKILDETITLLQALNQVIHRVAQYLTPEVLLGGLFASWGAQLGWFFGKAKGAAIGLSAGAAAGVGLGRLLSVTGEKEFREPQLEKDIKYLESEIQIQQEKLEKAKKEKDPALRKERTDRYTKEIEKLKKEREEKQKLLEQYGTINLIKSALGVNKEKDYLEATPLGRAKMKLEDVEEQLGKAYVAKTESGFFDTRYIERLNKEREKFLKEIKELEKKEEEKAKDSLFDQILQEWNGVEDGAQKLGDNIRKLPVNSNTKVSNDNSVVINQAFNFYGNQNVDPKVVEKYAKSGALDALNTKDIVVSNAGGNNT